MQIKAQSPEDYVSQLPADRQEAFEKMRQEMMDNLPKGFVEEMNYGMIGYVVPHSLYPEGYHCDPKMPVPFINLASQKNHIGFYHMGIYAMPELLKWFTEEFPKHSDRKLDMGKSCIRFKKPEHIPFKLLGELAQKVTPEDWIAFYQETLDNRKKK
ncbi:MAG TPA: hypothetical protein DCE41_17430 [Cytophagales bacterium]|nr:hypothetical protein [Cytophagales bacterium]HAA17498.1 hypothetical protein [Cytophagales bacterium]HAP63106.1 hypothetical protein [Cytophagales bacterium]